jgi:hypothetical protein
VQSPSCPWPSWEETAFEGSLPGSRLLIVNFRDLPSIFDFTTVPADNYWLPQLPT